MSTITINPPTDPLTTQIVVDATSFKLDPFRADVTFDFIYSNPNLNVSQITQDVTVQGVTVDSKGDFVSWGALESSDPYHLGDPQTTGHEAFNVEVPLAFFKSLGNTEDDITFDIILTNPTTPSSTLEYKVFVDIIGGPLRNNGNL